MRRLSRTACCLALLAAPAGAQSLLATLTGDETGPATFLKSELSSLGDVDGDGRPDWGVVSATGCCSGIARAYSGLDGQILWEREAGRFCAPAGDVDADGAPDVILFGYESFGVLVVRGADAVTLHHLSVPPGLTACFGAWASAAGDLDADGHGDILVADPCAYEEWGGDGFGEVRAYSGATGLVLHTVVGDDFYERLGRVAPAGDVDADGFDDFAIDTPYALVHKVRVYSGLTGGLLLATDFGTGNFATTLKAGDLLPFGDANGDGVPELLVAAAWKEGGAGKVFLLSGADLSVLQTWSGSGSLDQLGVSLGGADVDGDGVRDVLAASMLEQAGGNEGRVRAFKVTGGPPLVDIEHFAELPPNQGLLPRVAGAGDFDGDGRDELLVSPLVKPTEVWAPALAAFAHVPPALAALGAAAPLLSGSGVPVAGSVVTLRLANAQPLTAAHLVVGGAAAPVPFKGGTLVPRPDLLLGPLPTDADGRLALSAGWPPGLPPGLQLLFQAWLPGTPGPAGWTASNALRLTTG